MIAPPAVPHRAAAAAARAAARLTPRMCVGGKMESAIRVVVASYREPRRRCVKHMAVGGRNPGHLRDEVGRPSRELPTTTYLMVLSTGVNRGKITGWN